MKYGFCAGKNYLTGLDRLRLLLRNECPLFTLPERYNK